MVAMTPNSLWVPSCFVERMWSLYREGALCWPFPSTNLGARTNERLLFSRTGDTSKYLPRKRDT